MQDALKTMQLQLDTANSMVIKEREAAQKAIEESTAVTKETTVIVQDTNKIDSLTAEVEKLKVERSLTICRRYLGRFQEILLKILWSYLSCYNQII